MSTSTSVSRARACCAWKQRTPLGVLGVIYEARPQVTVDVAALALKSGNAVILRGGREVLRSNMALVRALSNAMDAVGLPAAAFQYIHSSDRRLVGELLRMHEYVDLIIPRGGNGLHNFCRENSTHSCYHRRHRHLPPLRRARRQP